MKEEEKKESEGKDEIMDQDIIKDLESLKAKILMSINYTSKPNLLVLI